LLLISLLLAGCAALQYRPDSIKVTLSDLRLLDSTLMEQRYLVKLRIQNRNDRPLPIAGMSFDLAINGRDFASGVSNRAVTVPPFDEATLELRLSSSLFGLIRQLRSFQELEHKPLRYDLHGRVSLGGSGLSLPFSESGEIDLRAPPGA